MSYHSINPYTEEEFDRFDEITNYELNVKLAQSVRAVPDWRKAPLSERTEVLKKAAGVLRNQENNHAEIITREMGKPISQARAEIEKCAWVCDYYAEHAREFLKPEQLGSTARKSYLLFQPTGIILGIMPWNFPFWQVFRYLAPNLVAGNGALLKHASNVPMCASAIELVFAEAGLPPGVFQNLFINYRQIEHVIRHEAVSGVTLTGSNFAGYRVAELAGKAGKKTVLELGGSDPYVVFEDSDLGKAMESGIMARFQNNGQSCIAAKRFILQDTIYEEFITGFTALVRELRTGDPMDPETMIGPVARKDLLLELEGQLSRIIDHGGKIVYGGKRLGRTILEPTIVTELPIDDPVNKEELFGPVIPIFRFSTTEQAIEMANNTPFGLGASVWTRDEEKAAMVAAGIETGTIAVNGMVKSEPALPFGGIKASGYGRELSLYGFREFLNIKTVSYY
jgi:succinate-semialdehyde dehydrogenase/glutarate-semialdehyde dehydrogenase